MIGREEALALLEKAVEEKGCDYVYDKVSDAGDSNCVYFHNLEPSCIVGHVLHYAGVTFDDISTHNVDETVTSLNEQMRIFTGEACSILRAAQLLQDDERPWSEALDAAKACAEELSAGGSGVMISG